MPDTGRMLLDLCLLFAAAKLAGELFVHLRQPPVVGEILVGIVIGPHALGLIGVSEYHDLFAELGVVFLLFLVGLETDPVSLWRVGRQAGAVGAVGVLAPFALGYLTLAAFQRPASESLFVATALTATSVGITARVLADIGRLRSTVARVIIGAAVLDDVLGMLLLAIVSGVTTGELSVTSVMLLAGEALAFVALAVLIGRPAVHHLSPRAAQHVHDVGQTPIFAMAISLCLAFSFLAAVVGLAAIIGAFFAGILFSETAEAKDLRRSLEPIHDFFVPIFFVIMGTRMELSGFLSMEVLLLSAVIILVAIVAKLVGCGLAALSLGRRRALAIGVGMVPRGEVGLVVASLGLSRGVISSDVYAEVILMCVVTSLLAPPFLRMLLAHPTLDAAEREAEDDQ